MVLSYCPEYYLLYKTMIPLLSSHLLNKNEFALLKEVRDLHKENYKTLQKEIKVNGNKHMFMDLMT